MKLVPFRSPLVVEYAETTARNFITPICVVHVGGGAPQPMICRAVTRANRVGDGNFLNARAVVSAASRLSAHVLLKSASRIGHHCSMEAKVSIGPALNWSSIVWGGFGPIAGIRAIIPPATSFDPEAIVTAGPEVRADLAAGKPVAVASASLHDFSSAAGFVGETDAE
jgi:UDP-3-O-[3-hydroxymyristoyl] glucosamine N-acyltransferase